MTEILTESFCERCGTRYTFDTARPRKRLKSMKVLSRGLKNFVLTDGTSMDEAMAVARSDSDRDQTTLQLDAFHKTFNFCMSCRQYTCPNCWNETDARCLTCAPAVGGEIAPVLFPLPAPIGLIGIDPADDASDGAAAAFGPIGAMPDAWKINDDSGFGSSPEGVDDYVDLAGRLHALTASEPIVTPAAATVEALAGVEAMAELEALAEAEAFAEVEALAEPVEALAEPVEALAEPVEAFVEPVDAMAELEALAEAEAFAEVEALAEPVEAFVEPVADLHITESAEPEAYLDLATDTGDVTLSVNAVEPATVDVPMPPQSFDEDAPTQTGGFMHRFRPGQNLDAELDAYERLQGSVLDDAVLGEVEPVGLEPAATAEQEPTTAGEFEPIAELDGAAIEDQAAGVALPEFTADSAAEPTAEPAFSTDAEVEVAVVADLAPVPEPEVEAVAETAVAAVAESEPIAEPQVAAVEFAAADLDVDDAWETESIADPEIVAVAEREFATVAEVEVAEIVEAVVIEPEVALVADLDELAASESEPIADTGVVAFAEPEFVAETIVAEPELVSAAEAVIEDVAELEPGVAAVVVEPEPLAEPIVVAADVAAVAEPTFEVVTKSEPIAEPEVAAVVAEPEPEPIVVAEPEPIMVAEPETVVLAAPEPIAVVEATLPEPEPIAEAELGAIIAEAEPLAEPVIAAVEPEVAALAEIAPERAVPPTSVKDVAVQPIWQMVAPDPTPAAAPAPIELAPTPTPVTAEPQWPARSEGFGGAPSIALPFLGRAVAQEGGVEALWAESARAVAAMPVTLGKPTVSSGVRPCLSCGLSLSASARFCRRCGVPQGV
jgi:hypothetical protein